MLKDESVLAIYHLHTDAEAAVKELQRAGIDSGKRLAGGRAGGGLL